MIQPISLRFAAARKAEFRPNDGQQEMDFQSKSFAASMYARQQTEAGTPTQAINDTTTSEIYILDDSKGKSGRSNQATDFKTAMSKIKIKVNQAGFNTLYEAIKAPFIAEAQNEKPVVFNHDSATVGNAIPKLTVIDTEA